MLPRYLNQNRRLYRFGSSLNARQRMAINQKDIISVAWLEDVHSIFGASAKSNFKFGYNLGWVTGLLTSSEIPIRRVTPKEWQRYLKALRRLLKPN